jgi:hypothetical protein
VVAAETENTSATTAAKKGDDLPPGTQLYIAWATDMMNDSQTNETRVWLESIVKDKSRIRERKSFPQIPEDELQKRYDSGRWGEDVDDYQKTISWTGLVLDDKGFNMVQEKKEWIWEIFLESRWQVQSMSPISELPNPFAQSLDTRKVEWGDWI